MGQILDPHIHLWTPRTNPRKVTPAVKLLGWSPRLLFGLGPRLFPASNLAFVGKVDHVMADYLPAHWRADVDGLTGPEVRGFVYIEAGWHARGALAAAAETAWVEGIGGPELLAIVGHAKLDSPRLGELLDAHAAASPRFVGIRDMLSHDRDRMVMNYDARPDRCADPAWREGYAELGRRGLSFDAWMYQPQLRAFEAVVAEHPGTRVVLDHLGSPIGLGGPFGGRGRDAAARQEIFERWREDLARLAAHAHVHAKISGLTMPILGWGLHGRDAPPSVGELVDRLGPLVEVALELFGPSRSMFASNFPMDKVSAPWAALFEAFDQLTRTRSAEQRRALFHDNAARFYGVGD